MTRPHKPHTRREAVDAGRERILTAARDLLRLDNLKAFSLESVAKRAGVTRMTVYNQFGSRVGLLSELFDLLVERGAFAEAPTAFAERDVGKAFDIFVGILGRFYTENRSVMARLATAAGTDPDLDEAMRRRHERRRRGIETLLQRLPARQRTAVAPGELVHTLDVLLNFATFHAIAGPERTPAEIVPHMRRLARAAIGLPAKVATRVPGARRQTPRKGSGGRKGKTS